MTQASSQPPNAEPGKTNENAEETARPSQRGPESSNHHISTSPPESRQPYRKAFFLVNRVNYFGLVISLIAPVVNFVTGINVMNMGVTVDLINWISFGVLWCGGFAMVVGPFFSFVASVFRLLDVVPALGSSLWIFLSIWLTSAVLNGDLRGFLPAANNLPFFSLIMANGIAALLSFELEGISGRAENRTPRSEGNDVLMSRIRHSFVDGRCTITHTAGSTPARGWTFPLLCVSQEFLLAYKNIREESVKYLRGEGLEMFSSSFEIWRSKAKGIRRVLLFRRLFCVLGYSIEIAVVYFSFVFLNNVEYHVHMDKDHKKLAKNPVELLLPIWQIVFVVILSLFSHYLWVFIHVESTCTSPAEVSSLMLRKMESRINWAGSKSEFLENGKRKWSLLPKQEFSEFQAGELPTIGIVADDTALKSGKTLLRSTVVGCGFTVRRVGPDTIRLRLVREDEEDQEIRASLHSESVEIGETDKVV